MPLRSFLFAPGNHPRRVEKALTLDADAVILDLEDAVVIAEKPATRETVVAVYGEKRTGLLYVRVNAADTEFCHGDFTAIVRAELDGVILPKVESAATIQTIDWLLSNLERERGLPAGGIDLIPIVETAALAMGFQGKMCIHPNQIPVVNRVFTPTNAEIDFAERVVAAFAQAEKEGSAAIQLDGKFIDYPIVYRAQRTLDAMAAIRARSQR
jgi:citrate lyase beta subunit